jgi:hypothetical protein
VGRGGDRPQGTGGLVLSRPPARSPGCFDNPDIIRAPIVAARQSVSPSDRFVGLRLFRQTARPLFWFPVNPDLR